MPQFNQSTMNQGTYVDPTFGINTLNKESEAADAKRKRLGGMISSLRSALARKGLLGHVTGTIDGDTGVTFEDGTTGLSGADAERAAYSSSRVDHGKTGAGEREISTMDTTNGDASLARVTDYRNQAQADQSTLRGTANTILGAGGTALTPITLPTPAQNVPSAQRTALQQIMNGIFGTPAHPTINPVTKAATTLYPASGSPTPPAPATPTRTSAGVNQEVMNAAQKHTEAAINTGSYSEAGQNIKRTDYVNDGGTVIDNVQKTNDDLLAEIEMAQIGAIASGNNGQVEALQKQYAQANAINTSVNNAYQKAGVGLKSTEEAGTTFNNSATGGSTNVSVGFQNSNTTHNSSTFNAGSGGSNPNEEKRILTHANGVDIPTTYYKDKDEYGVSNNQDVQVGTTALSNAKTPEEAQKIYKEFWKKKGQKLDLVKDPATGQMIFVDTSVKGNFNQEGVKGKAYAKLVGDGEEWFRDPNGNIVSGASIHGNKSGYTRVWHVAYFDENDPDGAKQIRVPAKYVSAAAFTSPTYIGGNK